MATVTAAIAAAAGLTLALTGYFALRSRRPFLFTFLLGLLLALVAAHARS
jgi:hypothetical protein